MVVEIFIKVKHLIKKILREEVDSSFDDRVRLFMRSVQKIPNLEKWLSTVKSEGLDRGYGSNNSPGTYVRTIIREIEDLSKWLSGDLRHFDLGEFAWMVVNTFKNNGGYGRDFSDKNEPLDLSPIIVYDVEAYYRQPMAEYGSMWGTTFGAANEEEAEQMMIDDHYLWEGDRETNDHDDYGNTEVYEINKVTSKELKFTKGVVGL